MQPSTTLSSGPVRGLHQLSLNQCAVVLGIRDDLSESDQALALRLLEIGFLPGERLRVLARGVPGNEPLAIRIGHTTFALRSHEASLVRVELAQEATDV